MDSSRAFLGKGFAFPPEVDPVTGHFRMAEGKKISARPSILF